MSTELYTVVLGYDGCEKDKGPLLMETYLTNSLDDAEKQLARAGERYGESKIVKVTLEDL